MDCPKCHNTLQSTSHSELNVQKCQGCGGLLLKDESFEMARSLKDVGNLDAPGDFETNHIKDIDCPECGTKMLHMIDRTQHHIEFEACGRCDNVFLDAGELTDLTEFTLFQRVRQALNTAATNLNRG